MKIETIHRIENVDFPSVGGRRRFDGSDFEAFQEDYPEARIYQDPNPSLAQKKDGVIYDIDGTYCTEGLIDKTPEELQQDKSDRNTQIESQRKVRYQIESDPLLFKYHRGEIEQQEWLDAVALIKSELPYEQ